MNTSELLAAYETAKQRIDGCVYNVQSLEEKLERARKDHENAYARFVEADTALQAHLDSERASIKDPSL